MGTWCKTGYVFFKYLVTGPFCIYNDIKYVPKSIVIMYYVTVPCDWNTNKETNKQTYTSLKCHWIGIRMGKKLNYTTPCDLRHIVKHILE